MGREHALVQSPMADPDAVRRAIALTSEARAARAAVGPPPLDGLPDVRPVLMRARTAGSVLDGTELLQLLPVLDCAPRLAAHGRATREVAPALAAYTDDLPRLPKLQTALRATLDADGALLDDASSRLGRVRREIRARRRRLVQDLERMLNGPDADRIFAERFVTLRHGRYVVPVRAEARGRVRGIVHDRSQSGQTIFVEPEALVDANNDLVELGREETEEAERILAELTDAVRVELPALDALVDAIAELDWTHARAATAERMEATAPRIAEDGAVALAAARHPLLLAQAWSDPARCVVPVDLRLAPERPILVITGPNAGGKTVALKTLGLLVLMAQLGCHVPAAEGSQLPVFDAVWSIIGDEQSVAENLSTFSAFLRQVRDIVAAAGPGSLVLLDELGAGTDPDEGAALAQAILETLDAAGTLVLASTHLEPLKVFASTYTRARNASVEFDTERLVPTFRLRYDVPGQSYALAIAARLGLSDALIARAQARRSADAARMSELLARLDAHARQEESHATTMAARDAETATRLAVAREAETAARARAQEIETRARKEAAQLVADVRRAVSAEWERLRRTERSRASLDDSRRRLREVAGRVIEPVRAASEADLAALVPGARVRADHLGLRGELVAIAGTTGTVQSGNVTVRVPLVALRVDVDAAPGESGRGRSGLAAVPGGEAGISGRGESGRSARAPARIVTPASRPVAGEILLLGRTTDEVRDLVEQYLDDAFVAGLPTVRLVHGKGTGALRKAVRELLSAHPLVQSFREGEPGEGGAGATVAQIKVS